MKALVYDGKLYVSNHYPLPKIESEEALIRVKISGICRTDLEIIKGYMDFKGVLGHEFVGDTGRFKTGKSKGPYPILLVKAC